MKNIFITRLAVVFFLLTATIGQTFGQEAPKYVFLFIGDGMGISHVHITNEYLKITDNSSLLMKSFPSSGVATTNCFERFITDSAAAATALSCGQKARPGMLGMNPDTVAIENISTVLHNQGKKVGIITTVSLDHATPAGFYAHQPSRNEYYEISSQLPTSGFEFFGGGGILEPNGGDVNFEEQAHENGYTIANTVKEIDNVKNGDYKTIVISPMLQDSKSMVSAIDRKKGDLTLKNIVEKGVEVLDNEEGFFMMVEGGKIDWLAHANDVAGIINETIDFDNALKVAYDFYLKHADETLIVVTADHETGCLTPGSTYMGYDSNLKLFKNQKCSYTEFEKIVENYRQTHKTKKFNHILVMIKENFGLTEEMLTKYDLKRLKDAFSLSMEEDYDWSQQIKTLYGGYDPLTIATMKILAEKAGVSTSSFYHSATPVMVYSVGVGSEKFEGQIDNTDIPKRIIELTK